MHTLSYLQTHLCLASHSLYFPIPVQESQGHRRMMSLEVHFLLFKWVLASRPLPKSVIIHLGPK